MTREGPTTALLLMGYGSPASAEEIPEYLQDVLHGRRPSAEMVTEYQRRYDRIGGSPQARILESLRRKLEPLAARAGLHARVYLGVKHLRPHLSSVIPEAAREGVDRLVAVPLSPYASPWILQPYRAGIRLGCERSPRPITVDLRAGWHREAPWLEYWAQAIRATSPSDRGLLLLSAHSLPERLRRAGDPYPGLVQETAGLIASRADLTPWEFTYQSAGNTTEPWLGPDIVDRIDAWGGTGGGAVTIAPFGFVFDHLEILYDLDIVVRDHCAQRGMRYHRVPSPNDHDLLVQALLDVACAPNWPSTVHGQPEHAENGR